MASEVKGRELRELKSLVLQLRKIPEEVNQNALSELFVDIAYRTPPFDWNNWSKGLQGLKNAGTPVFSSQEDYCAKTVSSIFAEFNLEELRKLLLMIDRVDRFYEGYFQRLLREGVLLTIIERMVFLTTSEP